MKKIISLYRKDRHISRLLVMLALWLAFMAIACADKFYTLKNFQKIASAFPEYGVMALGAMLCMLTGGIDLSSVNIANLTSILTALFMQRVIGENEAAGWVVPVAILIGLCCGLAAGTINGLLISKLGVPPILATLGFGQLLTGVSMVLTDGKAVSGIPQQFTDLINNKLLMVVPGKRGTVSGLIPVQLLIFIGCALVVWFLVSRTTYGSKLYMTGTGSKAALYSGLNVDGILTKTYALSGVLASIGGLLMMANYSVARADYGSQYTLQCVLIVVLGGVSPNGGKGKLKGVILSLILLALLESGINRFPQMSSFYITLIWGGVLLLVMVLNYFTENKVFFRRKKTK